MYFLTKMSISIIHFHRFFGPLFKEWIFVYFLGSWRKSLSWLKIKRWLWIIMELCLVYKFFFNKNVNFNNSFSRVYWSSVQGMNLCLFPWYTKEINELIKDKAGIMMIMRHNGAMLGLEGLFLTKMLKFSFCFFTNFLVQRSRN